MIIHGIIYCISHTKDQIILTYKVLKKYVSSEIIGYFWITSHTTEIWHTKKSISLPQVLEINKNYWTGSDGSTIEPLNRGLNSYHALPKIYLPIHFNFLSWTWIQVYIIATFWLDAIPIPFFSILYFSCSRILVSKWWPFPLQSCCLHAS